MRVWLGGDTVHRGPFQDASPNEGTRVGVGPAEIPEIRGFRPREPRKNALAGVLARSIFPGSSAIRPPNSDRRSRRVARSSGD
jgi:hypothetical protein